MNKDANGWIKGMDSAPHMIAARETELEDILVAVPEWGVAIAWWVEDDQDNAEGGYWDGYWRYAEVEWASDHPPEPTHWKPLDLPVEYQSKEQAA